MVIEFIVILIISFNYLRLEAYKVELEIKLDRKSETVWDGRLRDLMKIYLREKWKR